MAATHFAFLILGRPLDAVMFRGHNSTWSAEQLNRLADAATEVFLAAYGSRPPS